MSFYTGTQQECLYSWAGAGPALTATTTQTSLNPTIATQPGPKIPAFLPGAPLYRVFRLIASGIMTTSSAAVTYTIQPYKGLTDGTLTTSLYPAAATIGGYPAVTCSNSLTGLPWNLELNIILTAMGTSGTMLTCGDATWATSATVGAGIAVGSGTTTIAINTTVDNFISVAGTLGAVTAANTLTLSQLMLFGCN